MKAESAKQLTEQAADQIIQLILDQNMTPGERLPNESELAKMLGIGRSTLREAIRSLESRNVLTVRQGSGTYVSDKKGVPDDPLGLTLLYGRDGGAALGLDLVEIRLLLEPEVASMAAARIQPQQKKELLRRHRAVLETIYNADSSDNHMVAEVRYHGYIAECCGNSALTNLIPVINASISMAISTWDEDLKRQAAEQHTTLTNAICRQDTQGAKYAMIVHLNTSREYFIRRKAREQEGEA